jgi:hypothetical protein
VHEVQQSQACLRNLVASCDRARPRSGRSLETSSRGKFLHEMKRKVETDSANPEKPARKSDPEIEAPLPFLKPGLY